MINFTWWTTELASFFIPALIIFLVWKVRCYIKNATYADLAHDRKEYDKAMKCGEWRKK